MFCTEILEGSCCLRRWAAEYATPPKEAKAVVSAQASSGACFQVVIRQFNRSVSEVRLRVDEDQDKECEHIECSRQLAFEARMVIHPEGSMIEAACKTEYLARNEPAIIGVRLGTWRLSDGE